MNNVFQISELALNERGKWFKTNLMMHNFMSHSIWGLAQYKPYTVHLLQCVLPYFADTYFKKNTPLFGFVFLIKRYHLFRLN